MSQLPSCPNVSKGQCERSDIVLAGEQDRFYQFICRTCHLYWIWSKPATKAEARWKNDVERLAKATEADRKAAAAPRVFHAPRGGWTQ